MMAGLSSFDLGPLEYPAKVEQWLDVELANSGQATTFSLGLVRTDSTPSLGVYLIQRGLSTNREELVERYELLRQTNLGKHVPVVSNRSSDLNNQEQWTLLFELKECLYPNIYTLAQLLQREDHELDIVRQVLRALSDSLADFLIPQALESENWVHEKPWELLNRSFLSSQLVKDIKNTSLVDHLGSQLHSVSGSDLTTFNALIFDDYLPLVPNPVAYLAWSDVWHEVHTVIWPKSYQFGNLFTTNLIVTRKGDCPFYIADLGLLQKGYLFVDWFLLELDILLRFVQVQSHLDWKEFLSITVDIHGAIDLGVIKIPRSDHNLVAIELIRELRTGLLKILDALKECYPSMAAAFDLSCRLAATVAGLVIAVSQPERSQLERKAALFYSAMALKTTLPRDWSGEAQFSNERIGRIFRIDFHEEMLAPPETARYVHWVIEEGGASGHVISGLSEWFVDPETELVTSESETHYAYQWLADLEEQWGQSEVPTRTARLSGVSELKEFLEAQHRIVLLGEPGSGKTTLLERLFVDYASNIHEAGARIPVLIRLSSFRGEVSFEDFIIAHLGNLGRFYSQIKERLILLCDALNEMPMQSALDGRSLIEEVRTFLENTTIVWVLSCRVRDYVDHGLSRVGQGQKRIQILPLSIPLIQSLVVRQFRKIPYLADGLWEELCGGSNFAMVLPEVWKKFEENGESDHFWDWQRLSSSLHLTAAPNYLLTNEQLAWKTMHERKLMHLCRNPYMMTLIARVYVDSQRVGQPLPSSEGQIFHQVVAGMLSNEKKRRKITGHDWPANIDKSILHALRVIALSMHHSSEASIHTETEIGLDIALSALENSKIKDGKILLQIAKQAQILVGDERKLRFSHQLMQEYFAGMTLVQAIEDEEPENYWPAEDWWDSGRLHQTALILTGWYPDWPDVINWIAKANPELAAECMVSNGYKYVDLDSETQATMRLSIDKKIENASCHRERAAAFRALGWFGDLRTGVLTSPDNLPDIAWSLPIEAGPFIMGGDSEALNSWEGLKPSLDYDYFMAKYPITVRQYQCFVEDGGYSDRWRHCWTESGWKWKERGRKSGPYAWDNLRWTVPNHPVIGVTWFEAYAFANWLNEVLHLRDAVPRASLVIRLPTEAEWEKAARGQGGLKYPWGNKFERYHANVKCPTDSIGRTSAVGIFEDADSSVYGINDLSGNVWEWCLTEWREKYGPIEPIRIESLAARSSRGGSWFHGEDFALAASRFWYRPGVADFSWGFRVCASVSVGDLVNLRYAEE